MLQQASDLDDTVEDKLLVGDRPKQSNDPENKLPWKERLSKRTEEELAEVNFKTSPRLVASSYIILQLTPDEISLFDYIKILSDWLEPYHNHTRPPPAVVLAEATKQAGSKSQKRSESPPQNDSPANGQVKKEEEAPAIKEAPEGICRYFDGMNS